MYFSPRPADSRSLEWSLVFEGMRLRYRLASRPYVERVEAAERCRLCVGCALESEGSAKRAALTPDVPPPSTTTRPSKTPATPPSNTPLPPLYLARKLAPITTDMRPAISLIGSNNGKRWST